MIVYHHCLPSLSPTIAYHHCLPSLSTITVYHHRLPPLSPIIASHHCLPSLSTITVYHHCLPCLSTIIVYHCCLPSLSTIIAYLDELSWGVAQEGQVVQGVMQHGGPPGGPRMLQGPLPLLYWPATCIQMSPQSLIQSFMHSLCITLSAGTSHACLLACNMHSGVHSLIQSFMHSLCITFSA